MPLSRRDMLKQTVLLAAAASVAPGLLRAQPAPDAYALSPLPYAFDALEPAIDAATMEIHHGKHHAGYVANLNRVVAEIGGVRPLPELLAGIPALPAAVREVVRNHGGGHYNHELFWSVMAPPGRGGGGTPTGDLAARLQRDFGSFPEFTRIFQQAAMSVFGSGWAWLVLRPQEGRLAVTTTANQDNPLMAGVVEEPQTGIPLLGLDVWEHAYYLHYQNRRADYVSNWWKVVNWGAVARRLAEAG